MYPGCLSWKKGSLVSTLKWIKCIFFESILFFSSFILFFLLYFLWRRETASIIFPAFISCPNPLPPPRDLELYFSFGNTTTVPLNDNKNFLSIFSIWSPASERLDLCPQSAHIPLCVRITDVDRNSHGVCWEPISCVRRVGSLQDEMSKEGRDLYVKWP